MQNQQKEVMSVTELSKELGLSRSRFYQLVKVGAFPGPLYSIETRRPFFDRVLADLCREVRRKNVGVNGRPILFYSARRPVTPSSKPRKPKENHAELIEALSDLGLAATGEQVGSALKTCFPNGTAEVAQADVIRSVFIELKRHH